MDELLSHIEGLYNISPLHYVERVQKGILAENHILDSRGAKYFLKKYRPLTEERIREIHLAKHFFAAGGIPVILPLSTEDGATYFQFRESHYALFPYINGTHIERGQYDTHSAQELGGMLGKIHALGANAKIAISPDTKFWDWSRAKALQRLAAIKNVTEKATPKTEFDEYAAKVLAIKERCINEYSVVPEKLGLSASTLVHGDYLDHNVFFNADREVIAVFDWEKTEYAPRTYELWRCLTYAFIIGENIPNEIALAAAFLAAYRKEVSIENNELRNGFELFYAKMIHSLWLEEEHYIKNNTRPDHLLKESFPRFMFLIQHHGDFADLILTPPPPQAQV